MLKNSFSKFEFEAGIDEAGRGSIAGPVTASAVILPKDFNSRYLNDSKKLSSTKRFQLKQIIEDLEINNAKLNIDMSKEEVRNIVSLSSFLANGSGARGTPTFFVNDELVVGYISMDRMKALLK